MPPQRLAQNVVDLPGLLKPITGTQPVTQDWAATHPGYPRAQLAAGRYRESPARKFILGGHPHIAETIQPPPGAVLRAVRHRLLFVKVHRQWRVFEGFKLDVDEGLLVGKRRHVRAPAFTPVTYRGEPMSTPRSWRRPFFQSSRERKRRAKQKTIVATVCLHPNCRAGPTAAPRRWKTPHKSRRPRAA